jgi:hypothetical protein
MTDWQFTAPPIIEGLTGLLLYRYTVNPFFFLLNTGKLSSDMQESKIIFPGRVNIVGFTSLDTDNVHYNFLDLSNAHLHYCCELV